MGLTRSLAGEVGCGLVLDRKQFSFGSLFTGAIGHGSNPGRPIQFGLPVPRVQLDTGGCWVEMELTTLGSKQVGFGSHTGSVHLWVDPVFDTSIKKRVPRDIDCWLITSFNILV